MWSDPQARVWFGYLAASVLLHLVLALLLVAWVFFPTAPRGTDSLVLTWQTWPTAPPEVETSHEPLPLPENPPPPSAAPPAGVASSSPSPTLPAPLPAPTAPDPEHWRAALARQGRPPEFLGRSFGGGTVVFIIDISGSMLEKSGSGTRLQEAYQGLMHAIGGLTPSQQFNIILFGDRVDAFRPAPVPARTEVLREAFAYLDFGVDCGGSTNLRDALRLGLSMRPDTILLLSDGEANTEDAAILAEVRHLRDLHCPGLHLHTVGFYLQPASRAEQLLRRLSSEHGGTYSAWNPGRPAATGSKVR
jgi:hypothetical protein